MKVTFKLIHGDSKKEYGTVRFNGKFVFDLDASVNLDFWNKIGFIKLDESRHMESEDLFYHLNSRLPIRLRDKTNAEKIKYIEDTGLRVASDSFYLVKG